MLASLRVLGRGICFDRINELTNVSIECVRQFFTYFVTYFATVFFPIYWKPSTTPDEIAKVLAEYDILGFAGCIARSC